MILLAKVKNGQMSYLKITKKRDKLKKELCDVHGIKIIYFNYNDKIINLKNKIL